MLSMFERGLPTVLFKNCDEIHYDPEDQRLDVHWNDWVFHIQDGEITKTCLREKPSSSD